MATTTMSAAALADAQPTSSPAEGLHPFHLAQGRKQAALVSLWLGGAQRVETIRPRASRVQSGWAALDDAQKSRATRPCQACRWVSDAAQLGMPGRVPAERVAEQLDGLAAVLLAPVARVAPAAIEDWRLALDPGGHPAPAGQDIQRRTEG